MKEEKLLQLLQSKKGFFEAILELSESEENYSLSDWVSILEQKKILLSCIEEIDIQLLPYKQTLHDLSQEVVEELDSIRKVIEKILHVDSSSQQKRKNDLKVLIPKKIRKKDALS